MSVFPSKGFLRILIISTRFPMVCSQLRVRPMASKALHPSSLHAAVIISQGSEQIERFATCILELQR